ncbi:MAG: LytR C-terminal domain-containing protein [Balneolaceae bacterium]
MSESKSGQEGFLLQAAIGFLSVLLIVLLFALAMRIIYPRIESERSTEDPVLISDIIQLEVLNGCGVSGIASLFTSTLREYGFDVVETGNFDNYDMTESIILSRTGNMENARKVAQALGIPAERILIEQSPEFYLDATLVIGSDYQSLNINQN